MEQGFKSPRGHSESRSNRCGFLRFKVTSREQNPRRPSFKHPSARFTGSTWLIGAVLLTIGESVRSSTVPLALVMNFYILVCIGYVCWLHLHGRQRRLKTALVLLSHAVPSLVALTMVYIFLIGGGQTTAQFAAGNERSLEMWSLWVGLWPALLLATLATGVLELVLAIAVAIRPESRAWTPVLLSGATVCAYAFWVVLINFPDA